jgi:hypothetical protein
LPIFLNYSAILFTFICQLFFIYLPSFFHLTFRPFESARQTTRVRASYYSSPYAKRQQSFCRRDSSPQTK